MSETLFVVNWGTIGIVVLFSIFSYFVRKTFSRKKRRKRFWRYRILHDMSVESDTYYSDILMQVLYYIDLIGRKLLMGLIVVVLGIHSIIGLLVFFTSEPWNPSRMITAKFDFFLAGALILVIISDKFSSKKILDLTSDDEIQEKKKEIKKKESQIDLKNADTYRSNTSQLGSSIFEQTQRELIKR